MPNEIKFSPPPFGSIETLQAQSPTRHLETKRPGPFVSRRRELSVIPAGKPDIPVITYAEYAEKFEKAMPTDEGIYEQIWPKFQAPPDSDTPETNSLELGEFTITERVASPFAESTTIFQKPRSSRAGQSDNVQVAGEPAPETDYAERKNAETPERARQLDVEPRVTLPFTLEIIEEGHARGTITTPRGDVEMEDKALMLFMRLQKAHEDGRVIDTGTLAEVINSGKNYTTILLKKLAEALASTEEEQIIDRNYKNVNLSLYKIHDDIKIETKVKTSTKDDIRREPPVEIQLRQEEDDQGSKGIVTTPSGEIVLRKKQLSLFKIIASAEGSVTWRTLIEESGLEKNEIFSRLKSLRRTLDPQGQLPVIRNFFRIRNLEEDDTNRMHYEIGKGVRILIDNETEDPNLN